MNQTAAPPQATTQTPRPQPEPVRPSDSIVRSAVLRFAVASLVAFAVLVAAIVLIAERIAQHQALDDARRQGSSVANRLAAPLVNHDVRRGHPGAIDELDTVMDTRMEDGSLKHVKLWDETGRVLWADDPDLVGRRFALTPEVTALFGTTRVTAEISDLSREENIEEQGEDELLEVYAGAFDADGDPVVFEAYISTDQMESNATSIRVAFLPLAVGALTLFLLAVVPLAIWLGRRVQSSQLAQSRAAQHALLASDLERRRIAEDLHDGVIQDLAGLSYALPSVARELHSTGNHARARSILDQAAALAHRNVVHLRSLMTDIYPPDLVGAGLTDALEELADKTADESGAEVSLSVAPGLDLSQDAGRLAYRVVREGLRNVVKHAGAQCVSVELGRDPEQVLVRVTDDGKGPGPETIAAPEGHLGLRLLRDTIGDAGGELEIRAATPTGTSLVARFPARLSVG